MPAHEVRDLPDAPRNLWRIIGPGMVAAGVGVSSGEFILWPYIASQVGLVFLWGAVLGVVTQFFINMEIERYTLATGETALTGFNRLWRHWGLVFAALVMFGNLWPGWALSSATLTTYLLGGNPRIIAVAILVGIGAALTLAPVIYVALERLVFVKLAAVGTLVLLAVVFAIDGDTWRALPPGLVSFGSIPSQLGFALLMGAVAYAGAGGGQNLCQSNWIRDKGFGMGVYVPRLVSPVTGHEEADPLAASTFIFEPTPGNMSRWRRWWRFVNAEQALTFVLMTIITICLTSMLAHSTLFGQPGLPNNVSFLKIEGQVLQSSVGTWFGLLFWAVGAFSLFTAAMGIADYTSRLMADILKSTYLRRSPVSESRLYFAIVWGMVAIGCTIILAGLDQPLVLLVISACSAGVIMFLYSFLLIVLNRRELPAPIRVRSFRLGTLLWSIVFYGALAGLTIWQQGRLLAGPPAAQAGVATPRTEAALRIERLDPALDRLIDANAKIETLADGYDWSEGPVWVKDGGYLLFSDVPQNVVHRWKEGEKAAPYLTPSGYTGTEPRGGETGSNGLTLDREGRLVLAQHGDRRVSRMDAPLSAPKPAFVTLADRFEGARFNSPNDLVFRSNGDLYFTDPAYGMEKQWDDPRREMSYAGVFRRSAAGEVTLLTRDMTRPNGIAFSPDEKRLYVAQSDPAAAIIRVFDVNADGSVGNSRVFFDATPLSRSRRGLPDGLKVDVDGNVFTTGPGGVLVLSPDGKHLGTIMTGQATANCAFGDDGRTLFITADMYLMRVRLKTKGAGF
jgi:sugar lactone lactonase YvrE